MIDNNPQLEITKMLPTRLTRESFSDFGDVIEISEKAEHFTINDGYTERYHDLAQVDVMAKGGRTLINIFRSSPLDKPLAIKMMERHPLSSQAFMPLGDEDYLVVVAPAGDFDSSKIKVFLASSKQGVNYHPGTWHHYCLAVNNTSDFMVIDRGGDGENCDAITLDGSLVIEI